MARRYPVKITVIKKLSAKEIYGHSLPEVADDFRLLAIVWKWAGNSRWKNQERCPRDFAPGPGMISIPLSPVSALEETIPG